jgi:hypothetical protein
MSVSKKLSFDDTKRLLDHCCNADLNITAVKIAEILGVEPSRISEGRGKRWRLSYDLANLLIKKYGQPRGKPGFFVRAEERESIKSFIDLEPVTSKSRHFNRVLKNYNSMSFRNSLADKIEIYSDGRFIPTIKPTLTKFRDEKIEKLLTVMKTEDFSLWVSNAALFFEKIRKIEDDLGIIEIHMNYYLGSVGISDIPNIVINGENKDLHGNGSLNNLLADYGIEIDCELVMSLFLIGLLEKKFHGSGLLKVDKKSISETEYTQSIVKEYVISGDIIWSDKGTFTNPKIGEPGIEGMFFQDLKNKPSWASPIFSTDSDTSIKQANHKSETFMSVDHWTTYEITLFLKENCDYSLMLSLSRHEDANHPFRNDSKRIIVIPNISGVLLFDELEEMREWLTLPKLPIDQIKKDIAKFGGYVPGAIII